MARRLTFTEFVRDVGEALSRVRNGEPLVITVEGVPAVAVVPIAELTELERLRVVDRAAQFEALSAAAGREAGPPDLIACTPIDRVGA